MSQTPNPLATQELEKLYKAFTQRFNQLSDYLVIYDEVNRNLKFYHERSKAGDMTAEEALQKLVDLVGRRQNVTSKQQDDVSEHLSMMDRQLYEAGADPVPW